MQLISLNLIIHPEAMKSMGISDLEEQELFTLDNGEYISFLCRKVSLMGMGRTFTPMEEFMKESLSMEFLMVLGDLSWLMEITIKVK